MIYYVSVIQLMDSKKNTLVKDSEALVSIIIPTYNHAEFLGSALHSVINQTYKNWEALVVNNFSEDDTIKVVKDLNDSRIRLLNFKNNGLIAASRNYGIKLAKGKFVAFLDSDDLWDKSKLSKCINFFESDVGLVSHGYKCFGDFEANLYCGPEKFATFDALLDRGSCISISATIVRKDILVSAGYFSENPSIVTAEDYHLWLKLSKSMVKMKFVNEILGFYRIHSGNQSKNSLRHLNAVLEVVDEFFPKKILSNFNFNLRARKRYSLAYYASARSEQVNGNFNNSFPLIFKSILFWPIFFKSYGLLLICSFLKIKKALY
jgi:teichuronic acid biosynthesis glycosyltransferase TuaG